MSTFPSDIGEEAVRLGARHVDDPLVVAALVGRPERPIITFVRYRRVDRVADRNLLSRAKMSRMFAVSHWIRPR